MEACPGKIFHGRDAGNETNRVPFQLTLLRLSEPAIRRSHHICVPEGTGVTNCKNLQRGLLAESTYSGIPDFYELILDLKKVGFVLFVEIIFRKMPRSRFAFNGRLGQRDNSVCVLGLI